MFLAPFTHHRPENISAVFELLSKHGDDAAVYAGGTELLLALKARVLRYEHLIDLKRIEEFRGLRVEGDQLVIGALVTHHQVASSELVRSRVPAYAALSDGIANIRVRAAGTLAGNLGFAEAHSDPPSLLAAMGASVTLISPQAQRSVPVAEFIVGEFTTIREDNELISEIRIPVTKTGESFCYRKTGHLERPAVGVSAGFAGGGSDNKYRIWLGAIGEHPIHAKEVEDALAGVPVPALLDVLPTAARQFASTISATSDLHGSADYKQHLASVLIQRTLMAACGVPPVREARHA